MSNAVRAVMAALLVVAGCAPTATPSPPPTTATATPSPSHDAGPLPILIDTDMAGDDLMAVMALLREPAVEVRAIAIDGNGEVHCRDGLRNMRRLLGAFGAGEVPIACGRDEPGEHGQLFPEEWRVGADAFYGVDLPGFVGTPIADDAVQLIGDAVAASPKPLTIVALGPWTNLADALLADPELPDRIAGIHAMAGAIDVPGNIAYGDTTPEHGVEWNVGVDPGAVEAVLTTSVPITLVPLDATNDVPVPPDFVAILESDHAAAGADIAFEMFAKTPALTFETSFWDTLAAMALVDPTLVEWEDMTVSIESRGPSAGKIARAVAGRPIRAAMSADADAFMAALLAALRRGDPRPEPFTVVGEVTAGWDGTTCRIDPTTERAGVVRIRFANDSPSDASLLIAGVKAPRTWSDVMEFVNSIDLANPEVQVPDWIIQVGNGIAAGPGSEATNFLGLPEGEVGFFCATGEFPALEFFDGGSFTVAG
jgi:inosine-uridine nucleoside N-ribohydrolase